MKKAQLKFHEALMVLTLIDDRESKRHGQKSETDRFMSLFCEATQIQPIVCGLMRAEMKKIHEIGFECIEDDPNLRSSFDQNARICLWHVKIMAKDVDDLTHLNQSIVKYPDSIGLRKLRLGAFATKEDWLKSAADADYLLRQNPSDIELLFCKATSLHTGRKDIKMSKESRDLLMDYLNKSQKDCRQRPNAYYMLAAQYMDERKKLIDFYKKGLESEKHMLPFYMPFQSMLKNMIQMVLQMNVIPSPPSSSSSSSSLDHICGHCAREGSKFKCSNCKKVFYCSRECQVNDWKMSNHKSKCMPYKS
jgi:hypothetical protein